MSEEFNIFKNLEELRKTNLLDHFKALESGKTNDLNESYGLDNDDLDFDSLVKDENPKTSPTKRQQHTRKIAKVEKKSKKNGTSRRSSTSSNRSLSPTMPLLENLSKKVQEIPVGRRTRRSLGACKNVTETDKILENFEPSSSTVKGKVKGRGRGRGRAQGRGREKVNSSLSASCSHDEDLSDHASSTLPIMERFLQQGRQGRSSVMRAKRRYLAEIAARSTQVDYVDLVSSPMPRVEGFIELDSDTEKPTRTTRSKKKSQEQFSINSNKKSTNSSTKPLLDNSFDEDNPELNIKVNWKGKPEAFKLRKYQNFSIIFNQLAERENISTDGIVFNLNDRIIMADDTPDSINYKIYHFIDGRVLSNCFNSPGSKTAAGKKRDANNIVLKIQSDKWKRPLQINIMKTDKFRILYIKCAEELKVGLDQLKLSFDGELLELNDTPADLDLEGGEAIDLHVKK